MKAIFSAYFVVGVLAAAPIAGGCASAGSPSRATNATEAASHSLDGRTFLIEAEPDPERQGSSTTELAFAGGTLDSSACRARGLAPVPYQVRSDGTFYAERRSRDTRDTWTGRATLDGIEGTFVSMKGVVKTLSIPFRGRVR